MALKIVDDVGYQDITIFLYVRTMKSSSFCSSSVNGTLIEVFENEISARDKLYFLYLDQKEVSDDKRSEMSNEERREISDEERRERDIR